ncbi:DUF3703 domain-containing protein [Rhizobacter sp. LjRoot28]|uniref:DUF3703 domain-containing protein n=1 Tax=Rhizobacter sp. LjRoot28 TaxID=3342309 RepID=UPI003ECF61A7
MSDFAQRIRPHVEAELAAARQAERVGNGRLGFAHLERAHVLGQASTFLHVRTHLRMLSWAIRHRHLKEVVGQILRVVGAATKTALGWIPAGNTGGANVSPFKPMPVPEDLARVIADAERGRP